MLFLDIQYTYAHVHAHTHTQWLKEDFLQYLEEWETSVKELTGYTAAQVQTMLLSRETIEGIKITGIIK